MARVTLIIPPFTYGQSSSRVFFDEMPSLGVAYLAASLRHGGHNVTVVDGIGSGLGHLKLVRNRNFFLHGLTPQEIVDRIPTDTEVLGVSLMFSHDWILYKDLLQKIRDRFPDVLLVVGGEHATADAEFILRAKVGVDLCILGEGEETLAEVAQDPATVFQREIPGTASFRGEVYSQKPRRKRMGLAVGLYPAWDLFPVENYLSFRTGMNIQNRSTLPILATRGCPHSCDFCSSPNMWGTQYTVRQPADIVAEMQFFQKKYGNEHFVFLDLSMTIKRDWTIELANRIIDSQMGISWNFGPGTRTEIMDAEVIGLLKKSGLVKLAFASESGSDETLATINKRINLEKMFNSMRLANQAGLPIRTTFIFGFPGQTLKQCWISYLFTFKLIWAGIDEVGVFFFSPYPGSALHQQLQKQKVIPNKITEPDRYELFLESISFSNLEVQSWGEISPRLLKILFVLTHATFLSLIFLVHPRKIYRAFENIRTRRPVTVFEALVHQKLFQKKIAVKGEVEISGSRALTQQKSLASAVSPAEARSS